MANLQYIHSKSKLLLTFLTVYEKYKLLLLSLFMGLTHSALNLQGCAWIYARAHDNSVKFFSQEVRRFLSDDVLDDP